MECMKSRGIERKTKSWYIHCIYGWKYVGEGKEAFDFIQKKSLTIEPFSILEYLGEMWGITSNGAIIADIEGRFHIVGAILDGKSVVEGNSGRGDRYNFLVNYFNWIYKRYTEASEEKQKAWCFAVVLSKDGMVDLEVPL